MGLASLRLNESLVLADAASLPDARRLAPSVPGEYSNLLQAISGMKKVPSVAGVAVGFTGVHRGDGVSYAVEAVARDLAHHCGESVLMAAACQFTEQSPGDLERPMTALKGRGPGLWSLQSGPGVMSPRWSRSWLEILRNRFAYVIVDCAPPGISPEILSLGPALDGIVLIVSSGSARREEVQKTQHAIQSCGGHLIGAVLNKQRSALPWRQK